MKRAWFLALLISTFGCTQHDSTAPTSVDSGSSRDAGVIAAASSTVSSRDALTPIGGACTSEGDCVHGNYHCRVGCEAEYDEKNQATGKKYCQLTTPETHEGGGPCIGETSRFGTQTSNQRMVPHAKACSVDDGLFCDRATSTCKKTLSIGDACDQKGGWVDDGICGNDGICLNGVCARAMVVGASCKRRRCDSKSYCNDKNVCVPKQAIGGRCEMSPQCASAECSCVNDQPCVCVAFQPAPACDL